MSSSELGRGDGGSGRGRGIPVGRENGGSGVGRGIFMGRGNGGGGLGRGIIMGRGVLRGRNGFGRGFGGRGDGGRFGGVMPLPVMGRGDGGGVGRGDGGGVGRGIFMGRGRGDADGAIGRGIFVGRGVLGGRNGSGRGFGGRGDGGRFRFGGGRNNDSDEVVAEVTPLGYYIHPCEDDLVCKEEIQDVPVCNAPMYLETKQQIGKTNETFGNMMNYFVSIRLVSSLTTRSFQINQRVYIDPTKLLPVTRFLPPPPAVLTKSSWLMW